MIVRGRIEDFDDARVVPSDVLLVVEVADATLDRDRGVKLHSYARAGVGIYWIVNLVDRQIEVYTTSDSNAEIPGYAVAQILRSGQTISLEIEGNPVVQIAAAEALPPSDQ